MPNKKKTQQVDELEKKLSECTISIATDFTGMSVNDFTELRRDLREHGIEVKVVKNRLSYIAAKTIGQEYINQIINGPTAILFSYSDPTTPAKALNNYIKSGSTSLSVRGAVLNGKVLSSSDVTALAELPPKDILLGQLLRQLQAPITRLANQLQSPLTQLAEILNRPVLALSTLLNKRVEQLKNESPDQNSKED